mmetsp:Transcript_15189/g.36783  ORF Transcript_15189/g.36783 Transcript_15189/m.36783 type:complete len:244 (-) Transcript_15189:425-1156(-)
MELDSSVMCSRCLGFLKMGHPRTSSVVRWRQFISTGSMSTMEAMPHLLRFSRRSASSSISGLASRTLDPAAFSTMRLVPTASMLVGLNRSACPGASRCPDRCSSSRFLQRSSPSTMEMRLPSRYSFCRLVRPSKPWMRSMRLFCRYRCVRCVSTSRSCMRRMQLSYRYSTRTPGVILSSSMRPMFFSLSVRCVSRARYPSMDSFSPRRLSAFDTPLRIISLLMVTPPSPLIPLCPPSRPSSYS